MNENSDNRNPEINESEHSGLNELRSYTQIKLALADSLRIIRNSFSVLGREEAENQLKELTVKLAEDRFTLAVLGQFKRGKSSLMNAIIGKELLPTGVLPLTSAITILKYGPVERLVINREGSLYPAEVPVVELADYVTEKGNPQNKKKLKSATLEMPEPFLRYGIEFVDTPGVGSAISANTETTYQFLPNCDAVLFVTGADTPMTELELRFLQKIKSYVDRIFFVINKIDLVKEDEKKEIREFIANTIRSAIGNNVVKIFPVSSKLGLEGKTSDNVEVFEKSGLKALQDELAVFLTQEKSSTFLSAVSQKTFRIVEEERKQNIFSDEFLEQRRNQIEQDKSTRLKRDPFEAASLINSYAKKVGELYHTISNTETFGAGDEEISLQTVSTTSEKKRDTDENNSTIQIENKDVIENLQTRNCPVCEYTANQLFDYFVHWQYMLSTHEDTQQQFAEQSGFCPLHIWQLLSISSPFGASVGYAHFAQRLTQKLRSKISNMEVKKLVPDIHSCVACKFLHEVEEKYIQELSVFIATKTGAKMYHSSQGLCLKHLSMLLEIVPVAIHFFLLTHSVQCFEQDAEDMRTFALKNEALKRDLQNENERDAYKRAILRFAGDKRLCVPLAEDGFI